MSTRFRAEQTFFSPEVMSEYIKGQMYTVRPGNLFLENLVKGWLLEAKVSVLAEDPTAPSPSAAQIGGEGVVVEASKPSLFERITSWL